MLLPQPDSPTRPSVSPGWISSETSSTARTIPSGVKKCVRRFRISRRGCDISGYRVGVRGVAQPVAEKVEGEDGHGDKGERREEPRIVGEGLDVLGFLQEDAPAREGRTDAQPEEAQGRLR